MLLKGFQIHANVLLIKESPKKKKRLSQFPQKYSAQHDIDNNKK